MDPDSSEFTHNISKVSSTVDSLVGHSYIPAYPVYVLAVLQANEAATPIDTRASAYGYYYELLIQTAIAGSSTTVEYDIITSYLSHLAWHMKIQRRWQLSDRDLRNVHAEYEDKYAVMVPYDPLMEQLRRKRILARDQEGRTGFKYRYMYYYFTATHIRNNLTDETTREAVADMAEQLHVDEYANIMLFLAHLSKDPLIVQSMIDASAGHYSEYDPARLEDDVAFLSAIEPPAIPLELTDNNPLEERRRVREKQDILAEQRRQEEEEGGAEVHGEGDGEEMSVVMRLNGALKSMQILGQLLKNFPGSMSREHKAAVCDACYSVGLRTMSAGLRLVEENQAGLLEEFSRAIRDKHPDASLETIGKRAARTVVGLAWMIGCGMVLRIANAVGSPDLMQTYSELRARYDVTSVDLIDTAIDIEHHVRLPTDRIEEAGARMADQWLALQILRYIVVRHCQLFTVDFQDKQKVCQALDIPYTAGLATPTSTKLLRR